MNENLQTPDFLIALPKHKVNDFSQKLMSAIPESHVFPFPVLELKQVEFQCEMKDLINSKWLILSSAFGAETFFKKLFETHPKTTIEEALSNIKIAAVGPSINEVLDKYNLKTALQGKENNIASLETEIFSLAQSDSSRNEGFSTQPGSRQSQVCHGQSNQVCHGQSYTTINSGNIAAESFLFVTGKKTHSLDFMNRLIERGANCKRLIIYDSNTTTKPDWQSFKGFIHAKNDFKCVCLSSPEGVKAFHHLLTENKFELPPNTKFIGLGPATQKKAKELFPQLSHLDCSSIYSYDGIIETLKQLQL